MLKSLMVRLPRRETGTGELEELITLVEGRHRAAVRRHRKMMYEGLIFIIRAKKRYLFLSLKKNRGRIPNK